MPAVTATLLVLTGSAADARGGEAAAKPRVVFLTETTGCTGYSGLICAGFVRAVRRGGVEGRIVTPTAREDLVDTLSVAAKQRFDLVAALGLGFPEAFSVVAPRNPDDRFALIDRARREMPRRAPNVVGVLWRTSEAAYLAGWLAARMEQLRPGPDVVGVVGGVRIPSVTDFVIGFRAGARRAAPRIRVVVAYSNDFVDPSRCEAIARRQIANGAGVVFNVAGVCGLGTLRAAEERGVWGIGVDSDQSFLGPHVLTSVLKHFEAGFVALFRDLRSGRLELGVDKVLTLGDGAVGLGAVSRRVPAALRAELTRLERRIVRGEIRVPGAYPRR